MASDITDNLRQIVEKRADYCCEYCLFPQAIALHKHEIDHIIPVQHGGETKENNLALSCMRCNRYKGPNIGSFDPETGKLVSFFNPRLHHWTDHFVVERATIQAFTPEARVTIKILRINDEDRILERQRLSEVGLYGKT